MDSGRHLDIENIHIAEHIFVFHKTLKPEVAILNLKNVMGFLVLLSKRSGFRKYQCLEVCKRFLQLYTASQQPKVAKNIGNHIPVPRHQLLAMTDRGHGSYRTSSKSFHRALKGLTFL